MLPFSGQINRSDIYSTTEKVVGCWRDGRPLYQKTVTCGALPNNSTKQVQHEINNLSRVIEITGYAYRPTDNSTFPLDRAGTSGESAVQLTVNNTYINITTSQDRSNFTESYITLKYTKTTDAANSFVYASENDYSTSEKVIGTWIDGKLLYQRTFTGVVPNATTNGTEVSGTIGTISSTYMVKEIKGGFIKSDTTAQFLPFPISQVRSGVNTLCRTTVGSDGTVNITNSDTNYNGRTAYVTVKYTKP